MSTPAITMIAPMIRSVIGVRDLPAANHIAPSNTIARSNGRCVAVILAVAMALCAVHHAKARWRKRMIAACAFTCRSYTDWNFSAVVFKFGVRLNHAGRDFLRLNDLRVVQTEVERVGFLIHVQSHNLLAVTTNASVNGGLQYNFMPEQKRPMKQS